MDRNDDVDELVGACRTAIARERFGARYSGYDVAVALAPRAVDLQLVGATRAALRVGYTYERRWFARLTARLYLNRVMISEADPDLCDRDPGRVVRHEVDQLLDLVALAGARDRVTELRLDVTDEDRDVARTLSRAIRSCFISVSGGSRTAARSRARWRSSTDLATLAPVVITVASDCEAKAPVFRSERRRRRV